MFEAELTQLRQDFEANEDTQIAQQMKDYMRGQYSYYGIKKPLRSKLEKSFLQTVRNADKSAPRDILLKLWALPQREYQMTAIEVMRKGEKYASIEYIDLYEKLITDKSWWDTVDMIACNSVGVFFKKFPEQIPIYTEKWMASGNIWLQRTALLFQLKYRDKTDFELLSDLIRRLADSEEFFIRKAIGWTLRQYSKFEPEEVRTFLAQSSLSPLSVSEARKYL